MTSILEANEHYRYSLKQGMTGWDVVAIQIALNSYAPSPRLTEDGVFGPITGNAAASLQHELGVTVDGIVGPQTQAALMAARAGQIEVHRTPKGLLKGICFGESGGIVPTTSAFYPDGSRDYGPMQTNLTKPDEARCKQAFSPTDALLEVAEQLMTAYARFRLANASLTPEEAWRLAVLNYNWPAAAQQIAEGHESTWTYVESGTGIRRHMSDPAPWVEAFGISGVSTGAEWAQFYVDSKVVYVTAWTV